MSALIKTRSSLLSAQRRTHKVSWQCEKLEGLVSCFFFFFSWDDKLCFPTQKKKKKKFTVLVRHSGWWKRAWRRASDATASWPLDLVGEWKRETKALFFLVLDYKGERLELFLTDETKSYLTSYLSNLPDLKPSGDSERVCRVTARRTVHGSRRAARLSASSYLFHRSFYSVCLVPSETWEG